MRAAELNAAVTFLLERQDGDGLWRDYALEPGSSEAWTTSYVGAVVATVSPESPALEHARAAVDARRREDGWSYNSATASDADSTAWSLRFVHAEDTAPLERYLDADGRAHTFRGAQFGSWSGAHDDVTPVVGLALVAKRAPVATIHRVRAASLRAQRDDGAWSSFWWSTDAYAVARNLEFLAASGGVPKRVAASARRWLASEAHPASAFEAAQHVEIAALAGAPVAPYVVDLASRQTADGGWPPSATLLVPRQTDGTREEPHADTHRLLTTAAAVAALVRAPRAPD